MTPSTSNSRRMVTMTVQPDGTMTVTVDGLRLLPVTGVWGRESYPAVVDHATVNRSIAAVLEVREADGSVFRELVPAARATPIPSRVIEPAGAGFLPGEQVAVALIAVHVVAADDGTVSPRIEVPTEVAEPADLVLLGRTSGSISVAAFL